MNFSNPTARFALCLLLALVACLPSLFMLAGADWGARRNLLVDGSCFACAGELAVTPGASPYSETDMRACLDARGKAYVPFFYPPPSLLLFAALPGDAAPWLLVGLSVLALGFVFAGLDRLLRLHTLPRAGLLALAVFMAFSQTGFHNLPFAQVNIIAAMLLVWFAVFASNRQQGRAGLCLAFAVLLKSHFVLLLALPLVKREWRCVAVATAVLAGAAAGITLISGVSIWYQWAAETWGGYMYGNVGRFVQNPDAAATGLSLAAAVERYWAAGLPLLRVVAAVSFALLLWFGRTRGYSALLALMVGWLYLFSPVTWPAHYVFLLPLAGYLLMQRRPILAITLVLLHEAYVFMPLSTLPLTLAVVVATVAVLRLEQNRNIS